MGDEVKQPGEGQEKLPEPCCGNCVFYLRFNQIEIGAKGAGSCRRYPGQSWPSQVPGKGMVGWIPGEVMKQQEEWCGEHQDKDMFNARRDAVMALPFLLECVQQMLRSFVPPGYIMPPVPENGGGKTSH